MEQNKNKAAKFFCEHCGSEVKANAKVCPKCGKFFSSVRCPRCAYMGTVRDFSNGCPRCHYSMTHEDLYGSDEEEDSVMNYETVEEYDKAIKMKRLKKQQSETKKRNYGNEAPMWLFAVSIFILCGIIGFIVYHYNLYL